MYLIVRENTNVLLHLYLLKREEIVGDKYYYLNVYYIE